MGSTTGLACREPDNAGHARYFFYAPAAMRSTATAAVTIAMPWKPFRSSKWASPETIKSACAPWRSGQHLIIGRIARDGGGDDGWRGEGHHRRIAVEDIGHGDPAPGQLPGELLAAEHPLQLRQQGRAAGQLDPASLGRIEQAPRRAAPQQPRQRRVRVKNQPHAAARCDKRRSRR